MAHILVIDDEELARFTMREILEADDHTVTEAVNGNDGIRKYEENDIDLVITDIIMPDKEGVETIVELKHKFPDIKIIAVSGGGRTRNLDFLKLAGEYGAQRTLEKPFSSSDLINAVDACL